MKAILRWIFSWRGLILFFLFIGVLLTSTRWFTPTMAPENAESLFAATGGYREVFLPTDSGQLHAVVAGRGDTLLVFIHGSPGSWFDFTSFAAKNELDRRYVLLFVSRPGYKPSTHPHSGRLSEQAQWIGQLAEREALRLGIDHMIYVGHSYGGPVAMKLAVTHPAFCRGLILAAPTIARPMQDPRWYNRVAAAPPVKWLVGDWIKNSNREMIQLANAELSALESDIVDYSGKIVYIQGEQDVLVPHSSLAYFQDMCKNAELMLIEDAEMNHFIPWTHPHYLMHALDSIQARP